MSDQSQSSVQPQPSSITPDPQMSATSTPPSTPPGGGQQQALPISPLTGEPYDPEWGAIIQRGGDSSQRTIQQVMKPEIERKAVQQFILALLEAGITLCDPSLKINGYGLKIYEILNGCDDFHKYL